jgi:hypothetical protein
MDTFHLTEFDLHRLRPPKDRDGNLQGRAGLVNLRDHTVKGGEGPSEIRTCSPTWNAGFTE